MGQKRVTQLRPRGVVSDIPAEMVPPDRWTRADNVIFRDELSARSPGFGQVFGTPSVAPEYLIYNPVGDVNYWLYAGNLGLYATDGVTHSNITPASWTNPTTGQNVYTGETLNGLAFINDGVNPPVYWDGDTANVALDLPDWPVDTTAGAMRPYKFHLIAMNIKAPGGIDEDLVQWSDKAAPGQIPQSWTTGTTSDAGNNVIGDITGPLIDGRVLRDDFIMYKQGSTHLMQYVGGLQVFAFRTLFKTSGLLTRNAMVEVRGRHYVLSDGDVIAHDGQNIESIIDEQNKRTLFSLLDVDNFQRSFAVYNDESDEILFCFPESGATHCTVAAVYSVGDGQWGFRDMPDLAHAARGIYNEPLVTANQYWDNDAQVWNDDPTAWDEIALANATTAVLMASQPNTKIYQLDSAVDADGETLNALVSRESLDLGSPNVVKTVRRIWPKIKANPGTVINIRVGGQVDLKDGVQWSSPYPFVVDVDQSVPVVVVGKFISVEFTSDVDRLWELSGFEIEYQERSRF